MAWNGGSREKGLIGDTDSCEREFGKRDSGNEAMKASRILRKVLLLALVVGLMWCLVVLYWRATDAHPSASDLALYLGAMPLGLIGAYWLLRSGIDRLGTAPTQVATTSADDPRATPVADEDVSDVVVQLLASAVRTAAGDSAGEIAAALAEPKRPALHAQLKDHTGLPVLAAQVEGLDTDAMAEILDALGGASFPEERLRALTLLDPVAGELLLTALEILPTADKTASLRERVAAAARLRVQLLLPADWPQSARQSATDWLQEKAVAAGLDSAAFTIDCVPLATTAEAWQILDAIERDPQDGSSHDIHLLLAAESYVGQSCIARLAAQGRLASAGRQEGLVPGEAAAGVLLSITHKGTDFHGTTLSSPQLHRIASQRRQGHAPHARTTTLQLHALLRQSLASSRRPAEKIAAVISDADHRPSRSVEIAGTVSGLFPELDPIRQCLSLGVACGHGGLATPLALLAIASAHAIDDAADVMVVGLGDDLLAALVVTPAPEPSTAAAQIAAVV